MLQFLFELLVAAAAEGLWRGFVRAAQGSTYSRGSSCDWKNRFDDPVYKKNLQRLTERNRRFEETRE
jgi:hypothetical protein